MKRIFIIVLVGFLVFSLGACTRKIGPHAVVSTDPPTPVGPTPFTVKFDGSKSTSPNGPIATYTWDFGDHTSGFGVTVTHKYTLPANYPDAVAYRASLKVTDSTGATDKSFIIVTVSPGPVKGIVSADWREYRREGIASCDGPEPDHAGKRWYEPDYDDSAWKRLPLHDGVDPSGDTVHKDYFYRTPVEITKEELDRAEITITLTHKDAFWLWVNGVEVPRSEFANPGEAGCHEELGRFVTTGVLNKYLKEGKNTMALHLTSGDNKTGAPFLLVFLHAIIK